MKIKVKIPENVTILIKPGQRVDFKTPLAKKIRTKKVAIQLAQLMDFDPGRIFQHLKKIIGDKIQKGDILAENKSLFSTKKYLSQINGILKDINHESGQITIEEHSEKNGETETEYCFFCGQVDGIYDGFLELVVDEAHTAPLFETVPYFGSGVFYLSSERPIFTDTDIEDRCVFVKNLNPLDFVKMETLGARGLIMPTKHGKKTGLHQIILQEEKDFDHLQKIRYPYILIGHEPKTVLFYK